MSKRVKDFEDLALPHIAMITNISSSHIENFLSEKRLLMKNVTSLAV